MAVAYFKKDGVKCRLLYFAKPKRLPLDREEKARTKNLGLFCYLITSLMADPMLPLGGCIFNKLVTVGAMSII